MKIACFSESQAGVLAAREIAKVIKFINGAERKQPRNLGKKHKTKVILRIEISEELRHLYAELIRLYKEEGLGFDNIFLKPEIMENGCLAPFSGTTMKNDSAETTSKGNRAIYWFQEKFVRHISVLMNSHLLPEVTAHDDDMMLLHVRTSFESKKEMKMKSVSVNKKSFVFPI